MAERKPFHESVVDAIGEAGLMQLPLLANLINGTKIPKNHDAIIAAWKERSTLYGVDDGFGTVVTRLLEQKAEVASTDALSGEGKTERA